MPVYSMAPTSSLGPLQPITRGVEVDSQRDVIRRTEFWEDVHHSKLIGTGETRSKGSVNLPQGSVKLVVLCKVY